MEKGVGEGAPAKILPGVVEKEKCADVHPVSTHGFDTPKKTGRSAGKGEKPDRKVDEEEEGKPEILDDQIAADLPSHREEPSSDAPLEPASTAEEYPIITREQHVAMGTEDAL